ncbi:nuclease HARBI1-like 7 [Homarus americanus]|uniref:Nuclease HARBI1-like 7 n=1 Tax=Homarus americanus TaxID=6706 RepID=A0A8J5N569_HOMAM|nr:nuclease HARBI1-like 7 [Homarus americanus]
MNPFTAMSDAEVVDRFRQRKESVNSIIQEIQDQLPVDNDKRGCPVPPNLQVLLAIRCMATGSHQIAIGDCYDVSQACVSLYLASVLRAIANLSEQFIQFPAGNDLHKTVQAFYNITTMPGVIGSIDCTRVAISRPTCNNPEVF